MISIRAAPAAALARASGVRATPPVPTSAAFLPGRDRASLAPSRVARLAPARPARLSRAAAIPHAAVRFAPLPRRVAVVAGASSVAADGSVSSPDDDGAGSAGSKLGAVVAVALTVATAVAFAYGDLEPLLGAVNAEKIAPAQDVVRAALAGTRAGAERLADGAVEAALDIYDYAVLFAAKCQGLFAKLVGGSAGAEGATKTAEAVANTPVGAFAAHVAGGAAYFVDAAVNGQWAKILCYKPFRTVAAVTLTLVRIVVSWLLSGVEFACSMLYATPAYVAVIVVLAVVVVRRVMRSVKRSEATTNAVETTTTSTVTDDASVAVKFEAETSATVVESVAAAEPAEPAANESESATTMPASAVFEASDRLMTEEEKTTMMRRVEEAKAQSSRSSLSSSYSSYASSTSTSTTSSTSSSSSSYGASYGGSSSYGYGGSSTYGGSSASDVDQAEVDRIYAELTQKYSLEAESSSAQSSSSNLPAALPTSTSSSKFDADSFLSAFASDGEYKVDDYDAAAYMKDIAASTQTATMSSAATSMSTSMSSSSSTSTSSSTMSASATRETKSMEASATRETKSMEASATRETKSMEASATRETKSMEASATRETKSMEAAATEKRVSREKLDLSKVSVGKFGTFIESAAKKALEIGGPAAEKGWRETVELTKVVVPSVPKLVQGSVQGTRKREGASTSAKMTRSEGADEVTAAARAAKSTEETTTTEETVTTTTEVVTETKSMEMSAETMEETGTVWKKKNKSSE